jgi:hypothetical protein
MTAFAEYFRLARQLPWHEVCRRGSALVVRRASHGLQKWRDRRSSTYLPTSASPSGNLRFQLKLRDFVIPAETAALLRRTAQRAIAHEFDLLGSGPIAVRHGMHCPGIEDVRFPPQTAVAADPEGRWLYARVTPANRSESCRIWRMISQGNWARRGYQPIDWQIDIRSGYRWSELTYHSDIRIGPARGADIKLPWELARMQHLPQLALAARLGGEDAAQEIRAQILDFIASNPPRYGVNWKTPMDVAIRAVNWLVTLGLMEGQGCQYDNDFRAVVSRSIVEHGRHVLQHLEWSEEPRSNHYFANIVGLLFIATYLPDYPDARDWLGFAIREFLTELQLQFHADGSCYEASTGYHRLSGEMALFGAALLLGQKAEVAACYHRLKVRPPQNTSALPLHDLSDSRQTVLPPAIWLLLERISEFTTDIIKPDGRPILIGDQDSGRLLKLDPATAAPHDHRGLLRLAGALFGRTSDGASIEAAAILELAAGKHLPASPEAFPSRQRSVGEADTPPVPNAIIRRFSSPLPPGATNDLRLAAYPDFGLYILRSDQLFVALRCFDPAVAGIWGHSHDDNLAVELQVGGKDHSTDPGTYVYTSLPEYRDLYRSAVAHNGPRPAGITAIQADGAFLVRHLATGRCLHFSRRGISARLDGTGWSAERTILLAEGALHIIDAVSPGPLSSPVPSDRIPTVTNGYGCKTARTAYLP